MQNGHADVLSQKKENEVVDGEQMLTQVINSVEPVFDKKKVLFNFHNHMSSGHFEI